MIDDIIARLQRVEVVEKKLKDAKSKLRAELATAVEALPDKTYSNKLAEVSFTKGRLSRKVNYDKLLGYLGDDKYKEFVTSSTGKDTLRVKWND